VYCAKASLYENPSESSIAAKSLLILLSEVPFNFIDLGTAFHRYLRYDSNAILHWTHWPRYRVCYAYVFSDSLFVCGQLKFKHEKGDHSILNTPIYLIWPLRIPE